MPRGNGGIIGPANIPTTGSAKGVWSLTEVALAVRQSIWPSPSDPYFEYTTLLLPGNGTNGAQNNTFLDGSTNNFTITRNGNTTQGTFSPFSQTGWGNYLSGSSQYLTVADSTDFDLTSDYTIELWFYPNVTGGLQRLFMIGDYRATYNGIDLYVNTSNQVVFYSNGASIITGGTVTNFQWNHVALVRNGSGANNTTLYVNGSSAGQATNTTSFTGVAANGVSIGLEYSGAGTSVTTAMYVSNARLVKGTPVYTSNFTPPTSPLTAITNTVLLTCQSNRFIDTNTQVAAKTITPNGSPTVVAFSPFNPTASWSAATYGGSGYFDGSGDYLSVADNTNLRFGTNAFTIQAWVYRNASGAAHSIIAKGGASTGYVLQVTSTNVLRFTHGTTNVDTTTTIPASAWTHVAAVRTNTSTNGFQLYINGVSSATATVATDFNQTDTLYIGSDRSAANVMNGYISGLKYTNGTAESISVPTEPPTATTNVALLTNFTNAGIYDATSKNDLETVGNAQISTAISAKWGSGSMSFDGTGDYLYSISKPTTSLEGDFTIEFWLYRNVSGSTSIFTLGDSFTANGFEIYIGSSGTQLIVFSGNASRITSATVPSVTTWAYLAATRSGSTVTLYLNGTSLGTWSSSSTFSGAVYVGAEFYNGSVSGSLNGYIQDLRITKGYARTVTTTPTAAFPTL